MRHASMILGAGILAAFATAAAAETLTSRILDWNPVDGIVMFETEQQMYLDPAAAPAGLQSGDQLTVLYEIDEDGDGTISEITSYVPVIESEDELVAEPQEE